MAMTNLELFGVVGENFTSASVSAFLREADDVRVKLNSGGGFAHEGAAIHALLTNHTGTVVVDIIGIAASAASLIAMAGSRITMFDGAVLMVHDPMNVTIGNSADHAKTIEELETYARAYAKIYAKRSGKTEKVARDIMKAETWMDGPQAIAAGFADATNSNPSTPWASFDYRKYQNAERAFAHADPIKGSWKRAIMAAQRRSDEVVRG